MPVLGSGIIPSGNLGTELTYLTRRAFLPKMVVQIYGASPLTSALIANSQMASGGVSSVTVPVQGTPFVTGAWGDYSGTFNQPAALQGAYNAEFNLKLSIVPIPFLGMEGAVQMNHAIIPIVEARMNDAGNVMTDLLSTALWTNTTNNQAIIGLPGAADDGTNLSVYGGINRTANTWWKSKVYNAAAAPTRNNTLQYISGTFKNASEMPSFGICGVATWATLAQDFNAAESFRQTPQSGGFINAPDGPQASFTALMVAGVPIYADPYATEGTIYFINMGYAGLYIHESAAFDFTGFESTLPVGQIGYVGALVNIAELVVTKPKAMTRVVGYTTITI